MKTADGSFHYAYNAQAIVDQDHTRQGKFVLLRGLDQAAHEWNLIAACHNLMKLHSMQTRAVLAAHTALTPQPTTQSPSPPPRADGLDGIWRLWPSFHSAASRQDLNPVTSHDEVQVIPAPHGQHETGHNTGYRLPTHATSEASTGGGQDGNR
ncbi:hypothetical protein RCH23_002982 [Cryobacterium sp. CAN_C3]|uniref:hypothetical protein n=1 Tax=unclassified Cryobacterium TaxID=2649013 RepID=UPI0018C956A7|nr:hypothetical protein [Cryobacterium sp. CAN_C3]